MKNKAVLVGLPRLKNENCGSNCQAFDRFIDRKRIIECKSAFGGYLIQQIESAKSADVKIQMTDASPVTRVVLCNAVSDHHGIDVYADTVPRLLIVYAVEAEKGGNVVLMMMMKCMKLSTFCRTEPLRKECCNMKSNGWVM